MICSGCGRPLRLKNQPKVPGTVCLVGAGMCARCYKVAQLEEMSDEDRERYARKVASCQAGNDRKAEARAAARAMLTATDPDGEGWQQRGLCAQPESPHADLWFSDSPHDQARAKAICDGCPVSGRCTVAGRVERHGIWAGLDRTRRGARHDQVAPSGTELAGAVA